MKNIKQFLVDAKQNTYANNTKQTSSSPPNSCDLNYCNCKGDFIYLDPYVRTHSFSGQEIIWYKNETVWTMNYHGDVLITLFKSFFEKFLMFLNLKHPYKRKEFYHQCDYRYIIKVDGVYTKFSGSEKIFFKELLSYKLFFIEGR